MSKIMAYEKKGVEKVRGFFGDFVTFLDRGNVVDLAVGIIVGAAFTAIVTSFVNDIVGPFIALATPQSGLTNMFVVLRGPTNASATFSTLSQAQKAGVVTWNYGNFVSTIINFLIVALLIFLLVKLASLIWRKKEEESTDWPCPKCKEDVKKDAVKCPHCRAEPIEPEGSKKYPYDLYDEVVT